jgi:hypothetical protein
VNFIEHVNNWVLRRLTPKIAPVSISFRADGLRVERNEASEIGIPWREITQIVVSTSAGYIPSDFRIMFIQWGEGHVIQLSEDMSGWEGLPEAVDRNLSGAIPSHQWLLRLQSAADLPLTIYKRPVSPNTASEAS